MRSENSFGIKGVHHIAMVVPCLERAQKFYVDTLGLELVDKNHFGPSESSDAMTELVGAECEMIMLKALCLRLKLCGLLILSRTEREASELGSEPI